jgi:hypothetical protein
MSGDGEASQYEVIEAVLRAYDTQLAPLPVQKIKAANVRLGQSLEKKESFRTWLRRRRGRLSSHKLTEATHDGGLRAVRHCPDPLS